MNPTHSQIQVSNSESSPPSFITTYTDSQDNNILAVSPPPLSPLNPNESVLVSANTTHVTSMPQSTIHPTPALHPTVFFYRPSNDFYHYYVNCKEISYGAVTHLLNKSLKGHNIQSNENECVIYYQQEHDNRVYQISCQIASPLLVNNCLNKNFLGIELQQQNVEHENLAFTFDQRENLETHLLNYLSNYLLN